MQLMYLLNLLKIHNKALVRTQTTLRLRRTAWSLYAQAMKILLAIAILIISQMAHANSLLGNWKSDEERTLQEVRKIFAMPKKVRDLFENNFFGNLEFQFTENKIYSELDGKKYEEPYEVISYTDKSITIKSWSILLQEDEETTYYIEGEAIYVIISKYNFREYFKRVK